VRDSVLEKNKFDMLKAKALAYSVDPAGDYMRPGNNPAEQAFQLLKCGLEMLLLASSVYFPALDKKYQKKGPKWLRSGVLYHADRGTLILARAAPLLLARVNGRLDVDQPPELTTDHHRRLFDQVQSFYPLSVYHKEYVKEMQAEFTVMEEHKPRKAVSEGDEPPNEYSEVLLRGENPDDDPELVERQREYATDYFIDQALFMGISNALDSNDNKILKNKWARLAELQEPLASQHRTRLREAWLEGIQPYLAYARVDAQ
jgi:hypothetical protein